MPNFNKDRAEDCKASQLKSLIERIDARRTADAADVTLVCGEIKLYCHSLVLASSTPYFEAMFSSQFEEAKTKKVVYDIKDIEPNTLKCLVDFMYTGVLREDKCQTDEQLQKVLAAAHMMQLEHLTDYCVSTLASSVSQKNCFELWKIASLYNSGTLKERVFEFVLSHFAQISVASEFLCLSVDQVKELAFFLKENLRLLDELLASVLKWLMHDVPEREKFAIELLDCVADSQISQLCMKTLLKDEIIMKSSTHIANGLNKLAVRVFVFTENHTNRPTDTIRIRHRVENLQQLKTSERSPPKLVNGLEWRLEVECDTASGGQKGRKKGHKSLSLFVACCSERNVSCSSWRASAEAHVKLVSQKSSVMPFVRSFSHVFSPTESNWGWDYFFSWSNVLDPEFGFIKDGAIIVEVTIVAETPLFIP